MESKKEVRQVQADRLRAMWPTHTTRSEPVKMAFFQAVDRAVAWGIMAPVSMLGDMLSVSTSGGSIFVMFESPQHKAEFIQALKVLLADDPNVGHLG